MADTGGAAMAVAASAPAVSLEVQATPPNWGNQAWLPARALAPELRKHRSPLQWSL